MTENTATAVDTTTVQVYRVYIKASAQAIWDAITKPEWTERYGYGGRAEFELRPGGGFRVVADEAQRQYGAPELIVDGEVVECDPPRRLVQTWRMLMDDEAKAQGFTTLTYDIEPAPSGPGWNKDGITRLTVTHDLTGTTTLADIVAGKFEDQGAGGGWNEVLSGLKTLLETGSPLLG